MAKQINLVIASKKDGFRRCSVAHPGNATTYKNVGSKDFPFSAKQIAKLKAEPMLVVTEEEVEEKEKKPDPKK
tara:strand:+ start:7214 stop:7432 length:219 start_codon:yes stop_codon:yes gene_type:complete